MNVIRNVVLEVLDSNQKNQLLNDSYTQPSGSEASQVPSLLQGEAELAYLTHEGLFITDALNEAQQQQAVLAAQDQSSAVGFGSQPVQVETASGDPGTTEMSASREQSFMYVTLRVTSVYMTPVAVAFPFLWDSADGFYQKTAVTKLNHRLSCVNPVFPTSPLKGSGRCLSSECRL